MAKYIILFTVFVSIFLGAQTNNIDPNPEIEIKVRASTLIPFLNRLVTFTVTIHNHSSKTLPIKIFYKIPRHLAYESSNPQGKYHKYSQPSIRDHHFRLKRRNSMTWKAIILKKSIYKMTVVLRAIHGTPRVENTFHFSSVHFQKQVISAIRIFG
ncbi:hypothetical protein [Candidatus Uabimicrobium sp. HlEnr_7]|uniref:hypothetical protein n=1 Tax=Candidatus Uabimicrobium helgolandensis TaxID=3095367 RepID=UPI0035572C4E